MTFWQSVGQNFGSVISSSVGSFGGGGGGMSISQINGRTLINGKEVPGRNISVRGNRVLVDGKDVTETVLGGSAKDKNVVVLKVTITGNVAGDVTTTSGDIAVQGSIERDARSTSGDIVVERDIKGSAASTSGDIKVEGNIEGSASTISGNVRGNGLKRERERERAAHKTTRAVTVEEVKEEPAQAAGALDDDVVVMPALKKRKRELQ